MGKTVSSPGFTPLLSSSKFKSYLVFRKQDQYAKGMTGPFLKALSGHVLSKPPIWLMRQAGRYLPEYKAVRSETSDFISFCLDPERASTVTMQPIERFGFDAAIVFADILLVPMMFGQDVRFEEGIGPVMGFLPALDAVRDIDFSQTVTRIAAVSETVRRVRSRLSPDTALIGFAGAPWTVLTYMMAPKGRRDHDHAIRQVYADPAAVQAWLDLLVEATALYLKTQADAGADVLQLFDSWSEGLSEPLFEMLVVQPHQNLIARLRELGVTVPIIGFPRAAGGHYLHYASQVDVAAVGVDTSVPIAFGQMIQTHKPIQGNLDPLLLRAGGSALDARVDAIKAGWGAAPFIFNLGHGILPDTPIAHVEQLIKRVRG